MFRVVSISGNEKDKNILSNYINGASYDNLKLHMTFNNKKSIASQYNKWITKYLSDPGDTVYVFVHDDVKINCNDWLSRVKQGLNNFDVIGLAGIKRAKIQEPGLWHLMGERSDWRGAVAHPIDNKGDINHYQITSFGPMNDRVTLIDGVFMATTRRVLNKVIFDDSNPARYHFYDLDFCMQCNQKRFKIGIADIPIIHMSHGLEEADGEFNDGKEWFIKKWQ